MNIQVSVVIPTYNRKEILKETLRRILNQDFSEEYEVIVVDDLSTDGTYEENCKLQITNCEFKIIKNQKKGRASARNEGIKEARGEIVLFIDDDIWVGKDFIQRHLDCRLQNVELEMENCESEFVVVGAILPSDEVNRKILWNEYITRRYESVVEKMRRESNNLPYGFFLTGNVSLRKSLIERVGLFDEGFREYSFEDTDLGYRLKQAGTRIVFCEDIVGYHFFETDLNGIVRKAYELGRSAKVFCEKHPELERDIQYHSMKYEKLKDIMSLPKNMIRFFLFRRTVAWIHKIIVEWLSRFGLARELIIQKMLPILELQYQALGVRSRIKQES